MEGNCAQLFKRLFVSISLPDYVLARLESLPKTIPGIRWMGENQMHVTLKFIGDTDEDMEGNIIKALGKVRVERFYIFVTRLGCFPGRGRPGILWAGLGKGHPRLFQLQKKVEDSLFGLGIEPDTRAFQPHITLARCKEASPGAVHQFVKDNRDFETAPFKVEGFGLYSSHLKTAGSIYTKEEYWPLG